MICHVGFNPVQPRPGLTYPVPTLTMANYCKRYFMFCKDDTMAGARVLTNHTSMVWSNVSNTFREVLYDLLR